MLGEAGDTLGTLRVGTPLTTTVPINRRFLNSEGYLPVLGLELELDLEFHVPPPPADRNTYVTLPFIADSDTLGYISYHGADQTTYLAHIAKQSVRQPRSEAARSHAVERCAV